MTLAFSLDTRMDTDERTRISTDFCLHPCYPHYSSVPSVCPGSWGKVLGACFKVYNEMGPGFLEAVYHECLAIEFAKQGVVFVSRKPISIQYAGIPLATGYAPDFVCFGTVLLEIKSLPVLADEHRSQVVNYLKGTGIHVGLLVNFGHYPRVQYERFVFGTGPLGEWVKEEQT